MDWPYSWTNPRSRCFELCHPADCDQGAMKPMEAAAQHSPCNAPDAAVCSSTHAYAAGFRARAMLRDQTPVCIRAIRPDDKERLRIAFQRLSTRSVYQRFFHPLTELTPGDLRHLTELDFRDHVGLVLTIEEEAGERLIAVARFVRVGPRADSAEVGFAVADEYQKRGAATLLLRELVAIAKGCGIRQFVAQILEDNVEMLRVFQSSKLPLRQKIEEGIRRVELGVDAET
jgi:RimJ/RimL family protein N-acetyltransferase